MRGLILYYNIILCNGIRQIDIIYYILGDLFPFWGLGYCLNDLMVELTCWEVLKESRVYGKGGGEERKGNDIHLLFDAPS